jgi:hypothetical protein
MTKNARDALILAMIAIILLFIILLIGRCVFNIHTDF